MAVNKKDFVEYITNAIEETKVINDNINNNITELEKLNINLENNTKYTHDKYIERVTKSKLERLYSILNSAIKERVMDSSDEEIESYRVMKLEEIGEEINRYMLLLDSKDDDEKAIIKEKIERVLDTFL